MNCVANMETLTAYVFAKNILMNFFKKYLSKQISLKP